METEFYRFEIKYEIELSLAQEIENEIKKYGMKASGHADQKTGEYTVTSLYFDSLNLKHYYDKIGGFLSRKKLRARIYEPQLNESRIIWLELKKKYDAKTHKIRLGLSPSEWQIFIEKGPAALPKSDKNSFSRNIRQELMWNFLIIPVKPAIIVRYLRKPYKLGDLRITFDRQIEACKADNLNYNEVKMTPVKNKSVILEVKFSHLLPFWFGKIIQNYNLAREQDIFSKYCHGIDAFYRHNSPPK
jgi:SPX domain protein involved in polyphosphate accumulation